MVYLLYQRTTLTKIGTSQGAHLYTIQYIFNTVQCIKITNFNTCLANLYQHSKRVLLASYQPHRQEQYLQTIFWVSKSKPLLIITG